MPTVRSASRPGPVSSVRAPDADCPRNDGRSGRSSVPPIRSQHGAIMPQAVAPITPFMSLARPLDGVPVGRTVELGHPVTASGFPPAILDPLNTSQATALRTRFRAIGAWRDRFGFLPTSLWMEQGPPLAMVRSLGDGHGSSEGLASVSTPGTVESLSPSQPSALLATGGA